MHKLHLIDRWRGWTRRRRVVYVGTALVLATATTAAAIAIFTAQITGRGQVLQPARTIFVGSPSTVATDGVIDCTPTLVGDALDMQVSGFPGASCDVAAQLRTEGTDLQLTIQGVSFTSNVSAAFVAGAGCGGVIPVDMPVNVKIRFQIPDGAAASDVTAPASAGVTSVRPADFVSGDCPEVAA